MATSLISPGVFKTVLVVGQGPAGPQGLPGSSGALQYPAGEAISGGVAVKLTPGGTIVAASADDLESALNLAGVTQNAAVIGDMVTVSRKGLHIHAPGGLTVGVPVFLGLDGALVQSIAVGSMFSMILGVAVASDKIVLEPQVAIRTL